MFDESIRSSAGPVAEQPVDALFQLGFTDFSQHSRGDAALPIEECRSRYRLAHAEFRQIVARTADPDAERHIVFIKESENRRARFQIIDGRTDENNASSLVVFFGL